MPEPSYWTAMRHRQQHRECRYYADPEAKEAMCSRLCKEVIGASKACVYGTQREKEEWPFHEVTTTITVSNEVLADYIAAAEAQGMMLEEYIKGYIAERFAQMEQELVDQKVDEILYGKKEDDDGA